MARSRPSCSTSTRRLREELKPRALTLKSLTPFCTTSTPGTVCSAIGAWPVIDVLCSTSCGTTEIAAGASTMRSGARDAPSTTMLAQRDRDLLHPGSAVTVPSAGDRHVHLIRPVPEPAEHDRLRPRGDAAKGVLAVGARDGALARGLDGHRDAAQRRALGGAGHDPGDGAGFLRGGDAGGPKQEDESETAGGEREKHGRRVSAHTEDPRGDRPRAGAPGAARGEPILTSGSGGEIVYPAYASGGKGRRNIFAAPRSRRMARRARS